jgi:transposase
VARRHGLTDGQWALVAPLFPRQGRGGKWGDHRTALNGVMWRLGTGAPCGGAHAPTTQRRAGAAGTKASRRQSLALTGVSLNWSNVTSVAFSR